MSDNIKNNLEHALELARKTGADSAEAAYASSRSVSASVRLGKSEGLERSESEAIAVRIFFGQRQAVASSSDLSAKALETLVARVAAMAKAAPEDKYARLASRDELARNFADLDLFDADEPATEKLQKMALATEDAAMAVDGISNSEGADASYSQSIRAKITSNGFYNEYKGSGFGLSVSVLAGTGGDMQRDYAYSSTRHGADLKPPAEIGAEAAERTLRRLHPKKISTCNVPVVFDPRVGRQIVANFCSAINGAAIARGTSFLKNHLGKKIFPDAVSIIDNPLLKRGLASRPCDSEGIAAEKMNLVQDGILQSWLLDIATAAQLGLKTTGHASQSLGGTPSPAPSNLHLTAGSQSRDELLKNIGTGLYVSETFGMGVNLVTGDYSQGASGFWIENGIITYPVNEITIAGHLLEMFANLTAADDLDFRYSINAPTFSVGTMKVAGA